MTEFTKIKGTADNVSLPTEAAERSSHLRQQLRQGERGAVILRMIVRTLAMRLMILALTLASTPVPNAGSYEAGERLTAREKQSWLSAGCDEVGSVGAVDGGRTGRGSWSGSWEGRESYSERGSGLRRGWRWR